MAVSRELSDIHRTPCRGLTPVKSRARGTAWEVKVMDDSAGNSKQQSNARGEDGQFQIEVERFRQEPRKAAVRTKSEIQPAPAGNDPKGPDAPAQNADPAVSPKGGDSWLSEWLPFLSVQVGLFSLAAVVAFGLRMLNGKCGPDAACQSSDRTSFFAASIIFLLAVCLFLSYRKASQAAKK